MALLSLDKMTLEILTQRVLDLPLTVLIPLATFLASLLLITSTYVYTHLRYKLELPRHVKAAPSAKPQNPPKIPYTLPWLGNSLDFLAPRPGLFWRNLFSTHPRETGACTLLLGGQTAHVIFDPSAVQALFKVRGLGREKFNHQIMQNAFSMPREQVSKFYGLGEQPTIDEKGRAITATEKQEEIWQEFLVKTDAVNELTRTFTRRFKGYVEADERLADGQTVEVGLMEWLRDHMFNASSTALLGSRLLDVYPQLTAEFWPFERAFLGLFFGIPTVFTPKEKKARDTAMAGFIRWRIQMDEECKGKPVDPRSDVSWEPIWGSRASRARQLFYEERGLTTHSRAAADLGFLFGIASNAIPSAGWMLMHILDPNGDKTVLPRLMKELEAAKMSDGELNISILVGLPLLQSIWQEILRLYTDVLVTRDLKEDLVLPFDEGARQMVFRKGALVMAPSYLGHHDAARWTEPPHETFYADRFLKKDPETGKSIFTMGGTNGKLFPFGGGKTICPGRVFAKQEVLAAVALTLLEFDLQGLGYVDQKGMSTEKFPCFVQAFSGSGVIAMDGDVKVRMKRIA
jgi:Cytochrome P450